MNCWALKVLAVRWGIRLCRDVEAGKRLKKEHIVIGNLPVEVWRKPIKNINLAVYAPDGRVRISVPRLTSDRRVRQAVLNRMA